jgi:hypothetical protein
MFLKVGNEIAIRDDAGNLVRRGFILRIDREIERGDDARFDNVVGTDYGFEEGPATGVVGRWVYAFDGESETPYSFFVATMLNGELFGGDSDDVEFENGEGIMMATRMDDRTRWLEFKLRRRVSNYLSGWDLYKPDTPVIYNNQDFTVTGYVWDEANRRFKHMLSNGECVLRSDLICNLRVCPRCGVEFSVSIANSDEYLCPSCAKRNYVTPYHRYGLPVRFYSLTGRENDNRYLGVETEVELGGESDRNAAHVVDSLVGKDGKPFAYVSHDGSLNNGFEIITQPATLGYHNSMEEQIKNTFKWLVSQGYRAHNAHNSGIHVHVNRAYFGEDEENCIMKLLFLIEKFWDEIVIFSRRDYERSKSYMRKVSESFSSNDSFMNNYNKSHNHDGHYYALNITNDNTIEFRMFKSTLNVNTYMCILEFVDNLCKLVKHKSTEELNEMTFESMLTPRALEYYRTRIRDRRFDEI